MRGCTGYIFAALAIALLLHSSGSRAELSNSLAHLDFGSPISRQLGQVVLSRAAPFNRSLPIGAISQVVSGIQIDPGGNLKAQVRTAQRTARSGVSLVVRLASVPAHYGKRGAYQIWANSQLVLRSSEVDRGGGFYRSLVVGVKPNGGIIQLDIRVEASSERPIIVHSVTAYPLMSPLPDRTLPPMGLALVSSQSLGYSIDANEMRSIYQSLPKSPYLNRQAAVLFNFCSSTDAENAFKIKRLASLAESTGVPLRIAFQVHWGGTPKDVADGAGGSFSDLPYQQVTFDPADEVEDPALKEMMGERYDKRYGLTTPNVWSDTPWLSFNHPRLNQLRQARLSRAVHAWQEERNRLIAAGKGSLLPLELSTGEESVYWAQGVDDSRFTALNGGKHRSDLMADFNAFTVVEAIKAGVFLEPKDGLDEREREWLHLNLALQQQRIVDWIVDTLTQEPIRYLNGQPAFTTDLARQNVYTEPYAYPHFPLKQLGLFRPGMEAGYVHRGRPGSAFWSADTAPWLHRQRDAGRIAVPNIECTGANKPGELTDALSAAFAHGARFVTLYNAGRIPRTLEELRNFSREIESPKRVVCVRQPVQPGMAGANYVSEAGATIWGVNRVDLPLGLDPAAYFGAKITLKTMVGGDEQTLVITPENSVQAGRQLAVYWPSFLFCPDGSPVMIGIRTSTGSQLTELPSSVLIRSDSAAERTRSLVIQQRTDTTTLLNELATLRDAQPQPIPAEAAYQRALGHQNAGRYSAAYLACVEAEQLFLPARFRVEAPGRRLSPYWLQLKVSKQHVLATLQRYGAESASVTVTSPVAQQVTLRWGGDEVAANVTPGVPVTLDVYTRPLRRSATKPGPALRSPSPTTKPFVGPPPPPGYRRPQ